MSIMGSMKIKQIVDALEGGQTKLAEILNITQPSISYRVKHDLPVSVEEALLIAEHSKLSFSDLKPELKSLTK